MYTTDADLVPQKVRMYEATKRQPAVAATPTHAQFLERAPEVGERMLYSVQGRSWRRGP